MSLSLHPAVCAVEDTYQIMILEEEGALLSVKVGSKEYFCHVGGIRISSPGIHRIIVPREALDKAGAYTVVRQKMLERMPSYSKTGEKETFTYTFYPVPNCGNIEILHLADVHGAFNEAILAAKNCGSFDALVINGDISDNSDTFENKLLHYKITSEICRGEKPVIISRGNHDMRGAGAETLHLMMPGVGERPYFSFRLGCLWGIITDTGEDKADDRPEYGGVICCDAFRDEEEEWIKKVADEKAYENTDIRYRVLISHVPFFFKREAPFDIEKERFTRWGKLLDKTVKPHLMLSGHTHRTCISMPGSEWDALGQPCPIVVGSALEKKENGEIICLAVAKITFMEKCAKIMFVSQNEILSEETIDII